MSCIKPMTNLVYFPKCEQGYYDNNAICLSKDSLHKIDCKVRYRLLSAHFNFTENDCCFAIQNRA